MRPKFARRGKGRQSTPESGGPPAVEMIQDPAPIGQRACCCPALPVVQVTMPPTAQRPQPVDLWLCGHHYRVSRDVLAAAGATVRHLPGRADVLATVLFDVADRSRADVIWR